MFWKKDKKKLNVTEIVNTIENKIYNEIKQYGFKKHGRTLHRFVSDDISQVINFQVGQAYCDMTHLLSVNIGIRVPECMLRSFLPEENQKKYYHEYECNMRSRLGTVEGKEEACYDLRKSIEFIEADILRQIRECVIPVFNILSSREAILEKRREYPTFDTLNSRLILLEEAMIYGRGGAVEKAADIFNIYYKNCASMWKQDRETAHIKFHLECLDELAKELGIVIEQEEI